MLGKMSIRHGSLIFFVRLFTKPGRSRLNQYDDQKQDIALTRIVWYEVHEY
jgi:hypothetical protein